MDRALSTQVEKWRIQKQRDHWDEVDVVGRSCDDRPEGYSTW
jgi:hypothetical protein